MQRKPVGESWETSDSSRKAALRITPSIPAAAFRRTLTSVPPSTSKRGRSLVGLSLLSAESRARNGELDNGSEDCQ